MLDIALVCDILQIYKIKMQTIRLFIEYGLTLHHLQKKWTKTNCTQYRIRCNIYSQNLFTLKLTLKSFPAAQKYYSKITHEFSSIRMIKNNILSLTFILFNIHAVST